MGRRRTSTVASGLAAEARGERNSSRPNSGMEPVTRSVARGGPPSVAVVMATGGGAYGHGAGGQMRGTI